MLVASIGVSYQVVAVVTLELNGRDRTCATCSWSCSGAGKGTMMT
jgi:hypothetical protein